MVRFLSNMDKTLLTKQIQSDVQIWIQNPENLDAESAPLEPELDRESISRCVDSRSGLTLVFQESGIREIIFRFRLHLRGVFFQNGGNLPVSDKVTSKKHWHPSVFLSENVSDI